MMLMNLAGMVATAFGDRVGPLPLLTAAGALYIAAGIVAFVLMRGIVAARPAEAGLTTAVEAGRGLWGEEEPA